MSVRSFNACLLAFSIAACGMDKAPIEKSGAKATSQSDSAKAAAQAALAKLSPNVKPVCKAGKSGALCLAVGRTDTDGNLWTSNALTAGYTAQDLQSAYAIPAAGGTGVTVALIEFGDDPTAEDDLAVYRSQMGMKACTTQNGCFRKVDEKGELILPNDGSTQVNEPASMPAPDFDWAVETALDLDMVSAACPNCNILLVEGNETATTETDFVIDAGTCVQVAVSLGATAISNSYGGPETASSIDVGEPYFNQPGVSIFASSGDGGFAGGVGYPGSSQYVISAGGTNLAKANNDRGWAETAWNGATSGCSAFVNKPSWQTDTGCPQRMVSDVSAVADPATGVAVYVNYYEQGGVWFYVGGTSVSSPLLAGIWAEAGLAGTQASLIYENTQDFTDVTAGSTGFCNTLYECTSDVGYDGPTGVGSPNSSALSSNLNSAICFTNANCAAPTPICLVYGNAANNTCAECAASSDCAAGETCVLNSCKSSPYVCMTNADCAAPTPACVTFSDPNDNFCAQCGTSADCQSGQRCIANSCQGS